MLVKVLEGAWVHHGLQVIRSQATGLAQDFAMFVVLETLARCLDGVP